MVAPPPDAPDSRRLPRWVLALAGVVALVSIAGIAVVVLGPATDPDPGALPDLQALGLQDEGPGAFELAPDFTVPTRDGSTFSLAEHLATDGRPVFLNLWASWCFPCREEMPAIDAASRAHPEVAFVGVAVEDDRVSATSFVDEIAVTYVIGFDDDGQVDSAYRPLGLPATYLIDADGAIVERIFGGLTADQIEAKLAAAFGD